MKPSCCDKSGMVSVVEVGSVGGTPYKSDITTECASCGAKTTYKGCVLQNMSSVEKNPSGIESTQAEADVEFWD